MAVAVGFRFHHARPEAVTLTLAPTPDSFVCPGASHYVGAGGVVINDRRRVPVVSERFRGDMSRPYYKLPGGLHHREDLADAVTREVFEETGLRTRFLAINSVRHRHTGTLDHSDLYIVCRLAPLSEEIVIQASEIEECFWMPVDDYLTSPDVHDFNRRIVRDALVNPGLPYSRIVPDAEVFMADGAG